MDADDVTVVRDDEAGEWRAIVDGEVAARTTFVRTGDVLVMPHTLTDPSYGGQGIGSILVRKALDDVRAQGLHVRPVCWFVRGWIERHPDYADLLDTAART